MVQALPRQHSCVRASDVRVVSESLRALVATFEPGDVFVFDAPELWAEFSAIETLASAAMTLLARKVEDACTWRREGYRSAADQLAAAAGTSVAVAKRMLDTSNQLSELPATAQALRAGELSAAKAEAIANAAAVAPDAEAKLLDAAAAMPLAKVKEECLRAKAVDRDATHARIHRERGARDYTDPEGKWHFHAWGTPEAGARWRAAHGPVVDEMFKAAKAEDRREPVEAYAFDAFLALADRGSGTSEPGGKAKRPSARFTAIIRADIEALQRGAVEEDEVCEIAGLGPIPVRVARELLGDANLKLVITKGVDVANVTHLGRAATAAQQVALSWQSPCCTELSCTRTRRLENDHRRDWIETHHTRLDELDPLCEHHHDLKTRFGWALVNGTGKRPMVPPDDPRHPNYRAPPE